MAKCRMFGALIFAVGSVMAASGPTPGWVFAGKILEAMGGTLGIGTCSPNVATNPLGLKRP